MPIISKVEAKTVKGKLVFAAIITALTIGGVTMIYPFLIMISGAMRSEVDETDLDLVPRYLTQQQMLVAKFLEAKYNQNIDLLNQSREGRFFRVVADGSREHRYFSFRDVPAMEGDLVIHPHRVEDLVDFWTSGQVPRHWEYYGGTFSRLTTSENLRELRNRLARHYDGNIQRFNREAGGVIQSWQNVLAVAPDWLSQRYEVPQNEIFRIYFEMAEESPLAERVLVSLTGYFQRTIGAGGDNDYQRVGDFFLPRRVPAESQTRFRRDWREFVYEELNPSFVLVEGIPAGQWHAYLAGLYDTVGSLNDAWGTRFASFEEIALPSGDWLRGALRADYLQYIQTVPLENLVLTGPEYAFRDWLEEKYGSVAKLNANWNSSFSSFSTVRLPLPQLEHSYVQEHSGTLRWQYVTRNFINVFDALFVRGRAFLNTVIFCTLSVIFALLINPLAAYALSRFKLPGTYKILLLLMATMAFPPMVTLIPTFIILQKLDMMNTFAALILPTIASGYLIFLLKGFFDSLPRELYEAATIDGASEVRIFFQITMSLSKPILAVVALSAFNSAYTLFLYALLVAPREDMWLLSVWLYQFQATSSMAGTFASVLIASIPTLLVFIFCQNIIMRGLVVPVEK